MNDQATYASYCRGFTKLSIWYARKRILEGISDFENALNERVNIFRNTSLFKDGKHPAQGDVIPDWNALLEKVERIFDRHIADEDTTELEQQSLDVFWPVLEERAKTHKRWTPTPEQRPYEAWSFDYRSDDRMNIHIANAYAPDSPLSEKRVQFAAALTRLLEDSQKNRPDVEVVACGSWLNSVPTFLDLFTDTWKTSGQAGRNVGYNLQLMHMAGRVENRQQEISQISMGLKSLARELNVAVLALSQLSRAVESRTDHRPMLSDLRESGSIEQDADVVLMLVREEYYNPTEENRGMAEIIVGKQRNGPTGTFKLAFLHKYTRFESLSNRESSQPQ